MTLINMKLFLVLLNLMALAVTACTTRPENTATYSLARLESTGGTYYGVSLDWGQDSAAAYNQRLGIPAAVYVAFFPFPFGEADIANVDDFIDQVAGQRGMALITLQPQSGLDKITASVAYDFAQLLAEYNRSDVPVFVCFAHEMNGS